MIIEHVLCFKDYVQGFLMSNLIIYFLQLVGSVTTFPDEETDLGR